MLSFISLSLPLPVPLPLVLSPLLFIPLSLPCSSPLPLPPPPPWVQILYMAPFPLLKCRLSAPTHAPGCLRILVVLPGWL